MAFAVGTAAVGIGLQAFGLSKGNKAAKRAARLARRIGRMNAEDLRDQAVDVEVQARRMLELIDVRKALLIGRQNAAQSAANLDTSFGSAAMVQQESEYFAELDAIAVRADADNQIDTLHHQAEIAELGGQTQARAIRDQNLGQIIAGAAGIASDALPFVAAGVGGAGNALGSYLQRRTARTGAPSNVGRRTARSRAQFFGGL